MRNFTAKMRSRSFADILDPPGLSFGVQRMGWHVKGGSRGAELSAKGGIVALWNLLQRLRCPLDIYDERGRWCWGGYISEVQIPVGAVVVVATLDTVANKIRVAYTTRKVGVSSGQRKTTDWAQNDDSTDDYGIKELLLSKARKTEAEAETWRDTELAARAFPVPDYLPQSDAFTKGGKPQDEDVALVYCRGWWETLDWRYYEDSTGFESYEETGTPAAVKVGQSAFSSQYVRFEGSTLLIGSEAHLAEPDSVLKVGVNAYTASTIGFEDADDDRIYDNAHGFGAFVPGETVVVSGATEPDNNGTKKVIDVLADSHLVIETDLDPENPGASITITPQSYSGVAQSFVTAGGDLDEISLWMQSVGGPGDNAVLNVYVDSGGVPSGATLGTVNVAGSSIAAEINRVRFKFVGAGSVGAGITYWWVLTRSGAASASNGYVVAVDTGAGYSRGQVKVNSGGWVVPPTACDAIFEVVYKPVTDLRGFVAGEQVTVAGAANGTNNGIKRVSSADNYSLTFEEDGVDEAAGATVTITSESRFIRQTFSLGDNTSFDIEEIRLIAGATGDPSDNLVVNVRDETGAVLLATGSIAGSELSGTAGWVSVPLGTRVPVTYGTNYIIGVTRSGAADVMDAYFLQIDEGANYSRGELKISLSTTYTTRSPAADLNFVAVGVRNNLTQVAAMISANGQFIAGLDNYATSTLYVSPNRNGDTTTLAEVEDLLYTGEGGAVIAVVNQDRRVELQNEPSSTLDEYFLLRDGSVESVRGARIEKWRVPVGVWVKIKDLQAIAGDDGVLADASRFFVEAWEYDVQEDRLTPTARAARPRYFITGLRQG